MSKRIPIYVSLCLAILCGLIGALSRSSADDDRWHIRGALSEACTCNVPCTCNYGRA
jgi:hypothetical protein